MIENENVGESYLFERFLRRGAIAVERELLAALADLNTAREDLARDRAEDELNGGEAGFGSASERVVDLEKKVADLVDEVGRVAALRDDVQKELAEVRSQRDGALAAVERLRNQGASRVCPSSRHEPGPQHDRPAVFCRECYDAATKTLQDLKFQRYENEKRFEAERAQRQSLQAELDALRRDYALITRINASSCEGELRSFNACEATKKELAEAVAQRDVAKADLRREQDKRARLLTDVMDATAEASTLQEARVRIVNLAAFYELHEPHKIPRDPSAAVSIRQTGASGADGQALSHGSMHCEDLIKQAENVDAGGRP